MQRTVLIKAHALHACAQTDSAPGKRLGKRLGQAVSAHLRSIVLDNCLLRGFMQGTLTALQLDKADAF